MVSTILHNYHTDKWVTGNKHLVTYLGHDSIWLSSHLHKVITAGSQIGINGWVKRPGRREMNNTLPDTYCWCRRHQCPHKILLIKCNHPILRIVVPFAHQEVGYTSVLIVVLVLGALTSYVWIIMILFSIVRCIFTNILHIFTPMTHP
jgi:hypothetical protein